MTDVALAFLTLASCLVVGLMMALLGNLKLSLARRPNQADTHVRNLLTYLNLALLPLVLLAGLLVDQWGVKALIITGSLILALAVFALSAGLTYQRTIVAVLAASFGAAALQAGTFVLMATGLLSEVAASYLIGLVFVGLGALLTPPLHDLLHHMLGHKRAMAILALFCLAPAFLAAMVTLPVPTGLHHLADLFLNARVLMAGVVFFVYAPLEAFVSVWVTTYLGNQGEETKQSRWLAMFWCSMLASRLLFAVILHLANWGDNYLGPFLILPALLSAVILGNMSGTPREERALTGLILLGFCLGPVFPMLLGILFKLRTEEAIMYEQSDLYGTAYALLFVFGSVGSMILSPLVQLSAARRSIQAALRIPLFIALVLTAATLMFALLASRR
jgi:MFS family permease